MGRTRDAARLRRPSAALAALALACAALLACAGGERSPRAATLPQAGTARAAGAAKGVPILLYHHVSAPAANVRSRNLWVEGALFGRQIDALARAGYHGVTLGQVWRHWQDGARLPSQPIVVSFDDGYASQYRNAWPVLRRHRWPGVLNLQWNRLGVAGGLSRAQVRALVKGGWEIGDHSITHPDLTTIDATTLHREVATSRTTMERELGVPVDFFCYPYGHFGAGVQTAVQDAGFLAATTTVRGLASPGDDPYALNRIIAGGRTTAPELLRIVRRAR
jgi:peptidoglycan/xylan/chitin deacetylase (PgdA/CDA1 family)